MRQRLTPAQLLDKSIAPIGKFSLAVGLGMKLLSRYDAADYLIAGGLLLVLASWFADWWQRR